MIRAFIKLLEDMLVEVWYGEADILEQKCNTICFTWNFRDTQTDNINVKNKHLFVCTTLGMK